MELYNRIIALLQQLKTCRESTIILSAETDLAKLSDFLDDADLEIAKAIRNIKQAVKLAGKKK